MEYNREYIEHRISKLEGIINSPMPDFLKREYREELIRLKDTLEKMDREERKRKLMHYTQRRRRRKRKLR